MIIPDQPDTFKPMRKRGSRVNVASTERKKSIKPIDQISNQNYSSVQN